RSPAGRRLRHCSFGRRLGWLSGHQAVKEAGGIILVQDPEEAEYGSMPRSAIATGLADFVLPVREIAARLPELLRNRQNAPTDNLNATDGEAMQRILSHL